MVRDYAYLNIKILWFNTFLVTLIIFAIFLTSRLATKLLVFLEILNTRMIILIQFLEFYFEILKRLVTWLYYLLYLIKLASIALEFEKIAIKSLR